jgi:hypothetical protein
MVKEMPDSVVEGRNESLRMSATNDMVGTKLQLRQILQLPPETKL